MGYFSADVGDLTLSNFPSYPGCNWAVWIWPLRHTAVDVGDEIRVTINPPPGVRARLATGWQLDCNIVRRGS
jgi:hypothetical protein